MEHVADLEFGFAEELIVGGTAEQGVVAIASIERIVTDIDAAETLLMLGLLVSSTVFAAPPEARAAAQQARIQQGVASGQLTGPEARRLERHATGPSFAEHVR